MMLFDAHNHLQDDALAPHLPGVLQDLERIGIGCAVVNGTQESDWEKVETLAAEHSWILPSYGLHPWYVKGRSPDWQQRLEKLLENGRAAVGEIGLDRWIEGFDIEDQAAVFRWLLDLAARLNLPVSIHCLRAWGLLWDILRTEALPECGFLLHGYNGPAEMVEGFVRRGGYFSFPGYFLNARKAAQREVFRAIPAERLLVETDAPDMSLPSERVRYSLPDSPEGRVLNHPGNLVAVYEGLAEVRGWTLERLTAQVKENFKQLFGGVIRANTNIAK